MQSVFPIQNLTTLSEDQTQLILWYKKNKRDLPWRKSKDPYKIWISEVMLQQTTVSAVIPFYEKFMNRFPTILDLANATIEDVYVMWAGLGYYSRARNLHKSAQLIANLILTGDGFPQSYQQLLLLPGFGPYTARAVSSLAFGEKTGVLDGNVIRVLSRKYGIDSDWWQTSARKELQNIVDQLAQTKHVSELNQGLMELGATICTPKKVLCMMCPWVKTCLSRKQDRISERPRMRPRASFETWEWDFDVRVRHTSIKKKLITEIFLTQNTATPFLKNNWLPLSTAKKINQKPKNYDLKHGVTKFNIFCTVKQNSKASVPKSVIATGQWIKITDVPKLNPTSLMKKIIGFISEK
jgi:A/G-specific adenine glycosylase